MMRPQFLPLMKSMGGFTSRFMSSAPKLTIVEVDNKTGIATLTLNRPPVNSLNLELLRDIRQSILEVESNKSRGLILTSASKSVFCAGVDILEMYKPDQSRAREFWTALQDAWLTLYGSSIPTAAAINGHSPAGGCLLATACEYRVILPNYSIGLNETQLGIVAPKWFVSSFLSVLPRRVAERALNQGKMFTSEEALSLGLVDEIAQTKEEALLKCLSFFKTFDKVSPTARSLSKKQFRSADLQQLETERATDLNAFLSLVNQPSIQKGLGLYLEGLKKKSAK